jgi:uncharacterized protein
VIAPPLARRARVAFCALACFVAGIAHGGETRLALIIDDLGNQQRLGQRALRLPGAIAVAVLPHTPFAQTLAQEAHGLGKEVLVHVPMQPERSQLELGPDGLRLEQSYNEFVVTLASAVAAVPFASGVNNHMGSLLTRDARRMGWLMRELRRDELFFIDSYTTHLSLGLGVAREQGVPALKRDVFLDTDPEPDAIAFQWARLLGIAVANGYAVAIAHPYPVTLDFLEDALRQLDEAYTVVPLRALLPAATESRSAPGPVDRSLVAAGAFRTSLD